MEKKNRFRKNEFVILLATLMVFGFSFPVHADSDVHVTTTVTPKPGGMELNFDAFTIIGSIGETVEASHYTKNGTSVSNPGYTTQVGSGTGYSVFISGKKFNDGNGHQLDIQRLKVTVKEKNGKTVSANVDVPLTGSGSGAKIDQKTTTTNVNRDVSFKMDLSKDPKKYDDTETLSHISSATDFNSTVTFSYTEAY
jgi:hypothetical protein